MTQPHVPADSEYTAPGVAAWAPRVTLTSVSDVADGKRVRFEPSEGAPHVWSPGDADLALIATVREDVQLEQGREYFVYVVPVDAMVPPAGE